MLLPDSSIHLILTTFPICIYIMMTMKNADITIKNIIALSILANFVRYQSVRFSIFLDNCYIYTTKSLWVSDLGLKLKIVIFYNLGFISRRKVQYIFKDKFLLDRQNRNFLGRFRDLKCPWDATSKGLEVHRTIHPRDTLSKMLNVLDDFLSRDTSVGDTSSLHRIRCATLRHLKNRTLKI